MAKQMINKLSFKTTTLIATIGMAFYVCHLIMQHIPAFVQLRCNYFHGRPFVHDMYYAAWMYLLLGIIITTLVAMLRVKLVSSAVPTKSFRIMTYVLSIVSGLAMLGGSLPFPVYVSGVPFMYVPIPWRIIVLVFATFWLWMLSRQSSIGTISMAQRLAMIVGACLLCIPISLQFASAISYWRSGEILFLHSWAIGSWLKVLVPTILLCWYSIELCKESK